MERRRFTILLFPNFPMMALVLVTETGPQVIPRFPFEDEMLEAQI